jgi:hypothetical protein
MTSDDDRRWRWLILLLHRIGTLLVTETERELGMEPSIMPKRERERRKLERKLIA